MGEWKEVEISRFQGIASSNRHPQKNECQECKNFDTRYIDGDLTLRPGFTKKYDPPQSADYRGKLSSITWLAFQNFYIPEGGGQEVTVWVGKGTLAGETGVANATPANRNVIVVFSSHQFNGTSWVRKNWDGSTTGSYWLNQTIVTSLSTSSTDNECELDFVDANIISGNIFNNWTIINITKSPYEVAQVIDTYDWGTNNVGVKITNNNHSWAAEDEVVLMRNYIPYDSLIAMYSCDADDISFHKVLNDLKIGFGGQGNRIGLSIGYRKRALLLGDINFGSFTANDIESLATTNNINLAPYYPVNQLNPYIINIQTTTGSGSELVAGKYFFRLTGVTDNFNEYLIAQSAIIINTASDLIVRPAVKLGLHHPNLTSLKLYVATTSLISDNEPTNPYYLLKDYLLAQPEYSEGFFQLNELGYIEIPLVNPELHTDPNAAIVGGTDYNTPNGTASTGFFAKWGVALSSDNVEERSGLYCLKVTSTNEYGGDFTFIPGETLHKGNTYKISYYAKSADNIYFGILHKGVIYGGNLAATYPTDATEFEITFDEDTDSIAFFALGSTIGDETFIDDVSIKRVGLSGFTSDDIPSSGAELFSSLGYTPTFDMAKSWDQAIVTQGRTFLINPYIDKRYENKIFRSHISGAGAFMYDAVSAGEYIDLENFDGGSLVGVEVLPNMQFLALKDNGYQRVNPNTGATEEIKLGYGCISRRSIINFGDRVVWCGENDIYMSDGLNAISIAEGKIREDYRLLLTGLSGNTIFATRETKDNAYRFLMNAPALEKEYLLTKKGWITRVNANSVVPDYYSEARDGSVWFMDSGTLYYDSTGVSLDNATTLTANWKSVEMDAELVGESINTRDFIAINEVWADFTIVDNLLLDVRVSLKLYCDNTLYKTFTYDATHSSGHGRVKLFKPFTTKNCRRFYIEFDISGAGVLGTLIKLHSVGAMIKTIPAGHHN